MENTNKLNQIFETIAWGAFFVLWGFTLLFPSLPNAIGTIGIGLILIGMNIARSRNGLPVSVFTTTLGILAVLLGVLSWFDRTLIFHSNTVFRDPADRVWG